MEKRTREILAVILLVMLGVAVAGAMGWYILVGHNWNQAATRIDDLVGSMDGYTVIVYEGVVDAPKPKASKQKQKTLRHGPQQSSGASAPKADADGIHIPLISDLTESKPKSSTRLNGAGVAKSYREKGASVITLDLGDFHRYEDPTIMLRGTRRFGLFAVGGPYTKVLKDIRADVRYLKPYEVDFVMGIVDDAKLMRTKTKGIDVVIVADAGAIPSTGRQVGSTFWVDSPYKGEVQVVIVSPSGVLTAHTLTMQ